jgi:archaellum component FlaC
MEHEMRKYINTFKQKLTESENLNISDVMKRINQLKEEYDRIRNYDYENYDDEFDAMDRKRDIETTFYLLGINLNRFNR